MSIFKKGLRMELNHLKLGEELNQFKNDLNSVLDAHEEFLYSKCSSIKEFEESKLKTDRLRAKCEDLFDIINEKIGDVKL